jgi:hypothetical protein
MNSVYLELLGNAAAYSINYERLLTPSLYVRVGAGYFALAESDSEEADGLGLFPIMAGYLTSGFPHKLELAIGIAPAVTSGSWDDVGLFASDTDVVGTATIGYRYTAVRGFLLRIGFTPFFASEAFTPWGGLSVGYSF